MISFSSALTISNKWPEIGLNTCEALWTFVRRTLNAKQIRTCCNSQLWKQELVTYIIRPRTKHLFEQWTDLCRPRNSIIKVEQRRAVRQTRKKLATQTFSKPKTATLRISELTIITFKQMDYGSCVQDQWSRDLWQTKRVNLRKSSVWSCFVHGQWRLIFKKDAMYGLRCSTLALH